MINPPTLSRAPRLIQSAAVPYRFSGKDLEYLLITGRQSGRWVIPKGDVPDRLSLPQSAEREALEEAGVEGRVDRRGLGSYTYDKPRRAPTPIRVEVYALEVITIHPDWLEKDERTREWVSPAQAAERVEEPRLRTILLELAERLVAVKAAHT